jgi:hypothetical protein
MAASTFLIIGGVGMLLLLVSALTGADEADLDMDVDLDVDLDLDLETDLDTDLDTDLGAGGTHGGAIGGGVLEWLSIKAMSVAAVGFGFVGWALTSSGAAAAAVWVLSIVTGLGLWALAVKLLFPWLKRQQGHDLPSLESYQGLIAEVVVRIPPNGIGTVQFTDPSGMVVRRDARSHHPDYEVPQGKRVLMLLSTPEHVVVDEYPFLEDT